MSEEKYFDLHVSGIGYLNRIREVPVQRADPFLAVEINALHGNVNAVQYTRFDCRVTGEEAKRIVQAARRYVDSEHKVLVGFKLGDVYPDLFTYQQGDKAGQTGVSLKARLLLIHWVRVDGETVYTTPATETTQPPEPQGESTHAA